LGQCISNDRVCVDVSVDELDVNSITLGQEATVTLDALEGQSFTGTVTAVSAAGTNEGGNTKFTLTVTMDKDSSVLLGMSANVTLVTQSSSALLLPETAITEQAGKTFVYTSYDEKNDELGGLTEVTTGAADGESVAILSGLEQGTSCYYRYADSIRYSFLRR
jgi:multidrug efflux pump subunit AcrA (membrane-fusion protein)